MVDFELLLWWVAEDVVEEEFDFIRELGIIGRSWTLAVEGGDGGADEVFEL